MRKNGLVSNYTVAHYKVHKSTCNQADTPNVVDRDFDNREKLEVVVVLCQLVLVKKILRFIVKLNATDKKILKP